jgi:hypothetical protein
MSNDEDARKRLEGKKIVDLLRTEDSSRIKYSYKTEDGTKGEETVEKYEARRTKTASRHPRWDDHVVNAELSNSKNEGTPDRKTEKKKDTSD